ncbi:MAG: DUF1295 domain-containing protein [bacterium]
MGLAIVFGWFAAALGFAVAWVRQRKTCDASSVDACWTVAIALLVVAYAVTLPGAPARRALVAILTTIWSARLAAHLLRDRVLSHVGEDGRYLRLRRAWGANAQPRFFVLYQVQAALAVLFSLPPLAAMGPEPLDGWAWTGLAVALVAVAGESVADGQLRRFRRDSAHAGTTCRVGLWRYSRHPNYFFEWIHWWSYVLVGRGAPLTWLGPIVMLAFLYRVTGIPHTEAQALLSRGDDYREYQRTTSAFVPWFPRRAG